MFVLLTLLGSSFCLCLVVTPLLRNLGVRVGLVDRPDQRRKLHTRIVPVVGGIAVFLSGAAVLAVSWFLSEPFHDWSSQQGSYLLPLLLGSALMCVVGVIDDARGLPGRYKMLGQLAAIGIVMSSGFAVQSIRLLGWELQLGPLALPFTALWLLGAVNSLNLLDGMDGLLGVVGVVICATFGAMAALGEQWATAAVAFVLVGALLGFLVYNLPPATVFLGDAGSMLVGLVAGVLALKAGARGPETAFAPAVPLAVLALPICDTLAAIVRRKLTGRSIFCTDRGHLHHCLLRRWPSVRRALAVVACLALLAAAGGLAGLIFGCEWAAVLTLPALAGSLIATRLFGHAEFQLAAQKLRTVAARILVRGLKGKGQVIEVRLQGSIAWQDLWAQFIRCAVDLDLASVCLDVNAPAIHEGYYARWQSAASLLEDGNGWQAEIPLEAWGPLIGRVVIRGHRRDGAFWDKIATVAQMIGEFETPGLRLASRGKEGDRGEAFRRNGSAKLTKLRVN